MRYSTHLILVAAFVLGFSVDGKSRHLRSPEPWLSLCLVRAHGDSLWFTVGRRGDRAIDRQLPERAHRRSVRCGCRGVSRLGVRRGRAPVPGLGALSVPPRVRGFSTCRFHCYPRRIPPVSPLRRAGTSAARPRSTLVGASTAPIRRSQEVRGLYGQLKPFGCAGLPSFGLRSSGINKERPWHLVSSHAAPRFISMRPNPAMRKPRTVLVPPVESMRTSFLTRAVADFVSR